MILLRGRQAGIINVHVVEAVLDNSLSNRKTRGEREKEAELEIQLLFIKTHQSIVLNAFLRLLLNRTASISELPYNSAIFHNESEWRTELSPWKLNGPLSPHNQQLNSITAVIEGEKDDKSSAYRYFKSLFLSLPLPVPLSLSLAFSLPFSPLFWLPWHGAFQMTGSHYLNTVFMNKCLLACGL